MPLTDEEQRHEYERRMDQMAVNIEKMRFDIAETQRQITERQARAVLEQKWETRKFVISAILATAAAVGAGAALGNYLAHHEQPQQPQQGFVLPPGTVITTPAQK